MDILTSTKNQNKQNNTHEPAKEIQKLKVELNDRIFELHKLEQDHAQEKAQVYIQLQKEKQNYSRTIKELKNKIKEDNESWAKKIDQVRREKEDSLVRLQEEMEERLARQNLEKWERNEQKWRGEVSELRLRLHEQEQSFRKKEDNLVRQNKRAASEMQQIHHQQQQEKDRRHRNILSELRKEHEENLLKLNKMLKQEETIRQQAEADLQNTIRSHVREKIQSENAESNFHLQISSLNEKVSHLQQQINLLKQENIDSESKYIDQITAMVQQYEANLKKEEEEHEGRERQNCYKYSKEISDLKIQIQKLAQIHRKKQQCWLASGKMVLQLYQKRQSKKQDVKAIQKLEVELIKKDFMIERERKELKNCQLQLENMEEIYDRIFIFNSHLHNRSKAKNYNIKKLKASALLNQSNRSTIMSDKNLDKRYSNKNE